ncbi:hypothetical protein OH77DRAFT_1514969 [Trametes cingulata]|nr:hypothetical protein OH77DRAFT_1514969 [Trametes cingulata]
MCFILLRGLSSRVGKLTMVVVDGRGAPNLYVFGSVFQGGSSTNCAKCSFVDRDMFMRYYGGGIGHQGLRAPSQTTVDEDDFDSDSEWRDIDDDEPEGPPETAQADRSTSDSELLEDALDDPAEGFIAKQAAVLQCEEDVLRLVPELALQAQRGLLPPDSEDTSDNYAGEEDEDEAELNAHAELQAELEEPGGMLRMTGLIE